MKLPAGYDSVQVGNVEAFAAPEAVRWVRATLEAGKTLHQAATDAPGAETLHGRGPVPLLRQPGGRWAIRHYHRGGSVASLLGDRYIRIGVPRPLRELRASLEVARRGVETPRVVAGAVYPAGVFYRGDLATEYVEDSVDLADLLFDGGEAGSAGGATVRDGERALRAAGKLIARMARAGIHHPDLNAGNVLLTGDGEETRALLLDLDRCRPGPPTSDLGERLLARLERSLEKLARRTGRPLPDAARDALRAGVASGGRKSGG